ncbi:universal stress protein [candidate division KSB1 bacterium]|nr:universal stress protein [candidate division KSB1 bacterium]RQW09641.1 MAG: universal stress protein [candidate division KSB1 bacterium]
MSDIIRRILVYVDETEHAVLAAHYAVCLAKTLDAELSALFVVNTQALGTLLKSRIFLEDEEMEYRTDLSADAERYLNHVKTIGQTKGVEIALINTSGSVSNEIKKCVKERDIDLLIIGELSRIQSRRDQFYDETERAMRSVPCSVLMVKDEEHVWKIYDRLL